MFRRIPRRRSSGRVGARGAESLTSGKGKGRTEGGRGRVGVDGLYRAGCRRCHVTRGCNERGSSRIGPRSRTDRVE